MLSKFFRTIGFIYMCVFAFVTMAVAYAEETRSWTVVPKGQFEPSAGDYFLVDIENGFGYLISNVSQDFMVFPVMTGSRKYGTITPEKDWVILEKNIQPNRVIFSESGEFFRMYEDGVTRTSYGVHGYGYFDYEMERGTKFLSLGCVLVADDVLDMIEESYLANGEKLYIKTTNNVELSTFIKYGVKKD